MSPVLESRLLSSHSVQSSLSFLLINSKLSQYGPTQSGRNTDWFTARWRWAWLSLLSNGLWHAMEIGFLQSLNISKQNSKHDFLLERQEKLQPFDNNNQTKQMAQSRIRDSFSGSIQAGWYENTRGNPVPGSKFSFTGIFLRSPFLCCQKRSVLGLNSQPKQPCP